MNQFTKTFETVRGAETITAHVHKMDRVEAIDVYEQNRVNFANGGYRIEFVVNGVPRGQFFHSGSLGLDVTDADDVTRACLKRHNATA